jgi:hypothetical protein
MKAKGNTKDFLGPRGCSSPTFACMFAGCVGIFGYRWKLKWWRPAGGGVDMEGTIIWGAAPENGGRIDL